MVRFWEAAVIFWECCLRRLRQRTFNEPFAIEFKDVSGFGLNIKEIMRDSSKHYQGNANMPRYQSAGKLLKTLETSLESLIRFSQ
jgi:hypothetical protein